MDVTYFGQNLNEKVTLKLSQSYRLRFGIILEHMFSVSKIYDVIIDVIKFSINV